MINPNSSQVWLPKIEAIGLPSPRTITIPYSHHETLSIFDGERSPEFARLIVAVYEAARAIGPPCFIRTDLASAKHSGPRAYLIQDATHSGTPLSRTIEDNEMKFWTEPTGPTAILVRQYLFLEHRFTAFGGLPIAREWRYFADGTHVLCRHPYWPADALEGHVASPGWREMLQDLHSEPPPKLESMAIAAAGACGGQWSVDFARDVAGKWWLLDMATMGDSWHWPGCPNGQGGDILAAPAEVA